MVLNIFLLCLGSNVANIGIVLGSREQHDISFGNVIESNVFNI